MKKILFLSLIGFSMASAGADTIYVTPRRPYPYQFQYGEPIYPPYPPESYYYYSPYQPDSGPMRGPNSLEGKKSHPYQQGY